MLSLNRFLFFPIPGNTTVIYTVGDTLMPINILGMIGVAPQPHVPIYFGGASDAAVRVGAKHSDVYALFGEPRAAIQQMMERIRIEAAAYDRSPRFNTSFRPMIAPTEGEAWDKARRIKAQLEKNPQPLPVATEAEFSRRLIQLADTAEVYDECLWTGLVKVSGANGNTTVLVGTPEQVAEAIVRYYDMGVRGVLIRGFDPFVDAAEFGKELIPRIRALVAERDRTAGALAQRMTDGSDIPSSSSSHPEYVR
jgi:alkanesulfonate monooxygenase